jgi:hypothetical protein
MVSRSLPSAATPFQWAPNSNQPAAQHGLIHSQPRKRLQLYVATSAVPRVILLSHHL